MFRSTKITTTFESSRYKVKWTISDFKEFSRYLKNEECLQSRVLKMDINEAECSLMVYPYGKSQDDKDSISVYAHVLTNTFFMSGKIQIALLDSDVPIAEVEKDVTMYGDDSVGFDSIVHNDDTINNLTIICEMSGEFRVDEVVEYDDISKGYEPNDSNVFPPLR